LLLQAAVQAVETVPQTQQLAVVAVQVVCLQAQ
jgi:hypothetical protein